MLVGILGANEANELTLPEQTLGYFLLIFAISLLAFVFYQHRTSLRSTFSEQWKWIVGLSIAGFITAQLAPLRLPFSDHTLTLFSIVPLLLGAAFLHPVSLVVIGLFTGLGEALSETHQLLTIFNFALIGYLVALLMQQRYQGRPFQVLRHPITVGIISMIAAASLNGIVQFASTSTSSYLTALDRALYSAANALSIFTIEGIVGGLLVVVILRGLPQLRPTPRLIPIPCPAVTAVSTHRQLSCIFSHPHRPRDGARFQPLDLRFTSICA